MNENQTMVNQEPGAGSEVDWPENWPFSGENQNISALRAFTLAGHAEGNFWKC